MFLGGTFTHLSAKYGGTAQNPGARQQSFEIEGGPGNYALTASTPGVPQALQTRLDVNGNNVVYSGNFVSDLIPDTNDPIIANPSDNWGTDSQEGTTAHWVAYRAYQYYRDNFGIAGLNSQGKIVRIWITPTLRDNAYYQPEPDGGNLYFGVAQQSQRSLATVDIVGHEYGHGLSRFLISNSSNLGNGLSGSLEGRALNEGFSDIFGVALERRLIPEWNWTIGEDLNVSQFIRNMANPSASGVPQPTTYQGQNWDFSQTTTGHRNSGVLSRFFFLLQNNPEVGFDRAMQLAVNGLDNYLNSSSGFYDARNAFLFASRDLFGNCSPQERAVVNAALEVGLNVGVFNYYCSPDCNYQADLSGPSVVSPGQTVVISAQCMPQPGSFNDVCNNVQRSFNNQIPSFNTTYTFQAPSGAGFYTYTVGLSKSGCYTQMATKTIQVTGGDPCDFSSGPRRVGTWNGLEVQIRRISGKNVLVTALVSSPTDKYYPRGDNFWNSFSRDPNVDQLQSCLNAGSTDFGGLVIPGGLNPPSGYTQGAEPDGAVFYQQSGTDPCDFTNAPRRVGTWNGLEVQIRQYPGSKRALVTAVIGASNDKHYARGDNFWDNFTKDANVDQYRGCLNAGQTGWYGLAFPGGISPNGGYQQGAEPDGAIFFSTNGLRKAAPEVEPTLESVALVKIRPNPAQDEIIVTYTLVKAGSVPLRILDIQGRVLHQQKLTGVAGTNEQTVNVSALTTGLYAVEVVLDRQRIVHKLMKQ